MKRLTSLLLTATLWASFILSCSAQGLKMIPVHFHNLTNRPIELSRMDEQINFLNRIYTEQKTPFRFQLSSIDTVDARLGAKSDLNVMIEDLPCSFMEGCTYGKSAFPWDSLVDPPKDEIHLDPKALPNGKDASGLVLAHEIGHWFGLYHESFEPIGKVGNCMDVPHLDKADPTCKLTPEQLYRMSIMYKTFRQ